MSDTSEHTRRRKLERRDVDIAVEVFDAAREKYLGRLVNISEEGLMLMGDERMFIEKLYQLELRYQQGSKHHCINLGADCLWVREGSIDASHWAGFQIIDISPDSRSAVDNLVESMSKAS